MWNQIYQIVYKYLKEDINSENDLFHRSEKCLRNSFEFSEVID